VHEEVIEKIVLFASANGFEVLGLDYSPVKGPEGNIEYLVHIKKVDEPAEPDVDIAGIVAAAHGALDK